MKGKVEIAIGPGAVYITRIIGGVFLSLWLVRVGKDGKKKIYFSIMM